MNSRFLKRPPKHRFAARSGNAIWPIGFPVAVEHPHAIQFCFAHAPATPQIACDIDAETVRRPSLGVDEDAIVSQPLPAIHHVECPDQPVRRGAGGDHV